MAIAFLAGLGFAVAAYREWRAHRLANRLFAGTMTAIQQHQRDAVEKLRGSLGSCWDIAADARPRYF